MSDSLSPALLSFLWLLLQKSQGELTTKHSHSCFNPDLVCDWFRHILSFWWLSFCGECYNETTPLITFCGDVITLSHVTNPPAIRLSCLLLISGSLRDWGNLYIILVFCIIRHEKYCKFFKPSFYFCIVSKSVDTNSLLRFTFSFFSFLHSSSSSLFPPLPLISCLSSHILLQFFCICTGSRVPFPASCWSRSRPCSTLHLGAVGSSWIRCRKFCSWARSVRLTVRWLRVGFMWRLRQSIVTSFLPVSWNSWAN